MASLQEYSIAGSHPHALAALGLFELERSGVHTTI